jgi:hypothetical protein
MIYFLVTQKLNTFSKNFKKTKIHETDFTPIQSKTQTYIHNF